MVKELLALADELGSTPGDAIFCFFVPFFFSVYSLFFNRIFPLGLFSFVLTSDPPDLALGSIYILSLSPDFYFGKGISWSWSWSFVHCLNHNSIIFKFKFKVDRLQIMVVAKKYIYVS